jgi:hypothetical protein
LVEDALGFDNARVTAANVAKSGRPRARWRRHVRSTDGNQALSSMGSGGISRLGAAVFSRQLVGRAGIRGRRVDWRAASYAGAAAVSGIRQALTFTFHEVKKTPLRC